MSGVAGGTKVVEGFGGVAVGRRKPNVGGGCWWRIIFYEFGRLGLLTIN